MEKIITGFLQSFNYLSTITLSDFFDILIVGFLIYQTIGFIRRTNSHNLAKGIFFILITLLLSEILHLTMINYLIRKALELGLIAIVILFQPELRRFLERVGSKGVLFGRADSSASVNDISHVVIACSEMSESKTGALIAFERDVSLNEAINTGTLINADLNSELIKNIFFNKAPLHDGAAIVRNGRLYSAGCMLPLTKSQNLSKELGMRHRAGIGLSEASDAVVVIVSEETGAISVAIDGMLKRHLTPANLDKLLRSELMPVENDNRKSFIKRLMNGFKNEKQ